MIRESAHPLEKLKPKSRKRKSTKRENLAENGGKEQKVENDKIKPEAELLEK